jgi:hypothetical protein
MLRENPENTKNCSVFQERSTSRPNLTLTPKKSGYLAIVGIEDFRLKESNVRAEQRRQHSLINPDLPENR